MSNRLEAALSLGRGSDRENRGRPRHASSSSSTAAFRGGHIGPGTLEKGQRRFDGAGEVPQGDGALRERRGLPKAQGGCRAVWRCGYLVCVSVRERGSGYLVFLLYGAVCVECSVSRGNVWHLRKYFSRIPHSKKSGSLNYSVNAARWCPPPPHQPGEDSGPRLSTHALKKSQEKKKPLFAVVPNLIQNGEEMKFQCRSGLSHTSR